MCFINYQFGWELSLGQLLLLCFNNYNVFKIIDIYVTNVVNNDIYVTNVLNNDIYAINAVNTDIYVTNAVNNDIYVTNAVK